MTISGSKYYTAYDLTIRSEFELPELPTISEKDPVDVVIRNGRLDSAIVSDSNQTTQTIRPEPGVCRVTHRRIGTFLVRDGEEIICDPVSSEVISEKVFRRFLEGQIMALLLLQRDLLVLHASAVAVDGHGIVFLGPRGAGKSTTAYAFHQEGFTLLEDDIVAIRLEEGTPVVLPGIPQLRLTPSAIDSLHIHGATRPAVDWGPIKHYYSVDTRPSPVPLAGCCILEEDETLSISELSGSDRFLRFIEHVYPRGILSDSVMTDEDFDRCSKVVRSASIQLLRRPKEFEELQSLVRLVADEIRSDP